MNRQEEIEQIAYELWEEEGMPEGKETEIWLKAEEIWQETNSVETSTPEAELQEQPEKPWKRRTTKK